MMVDTTIYGWVLETEVICAKCADLDRWSQGIQRLLGENGARPLYSIDDGESSGLSCDGGDADCTGWVFEPCCNECYAEHTDEADLEYQDFDDHYLCAECRKADTSDKEGA